MNSNKNIIINFNMDTFESFLRQLSMYLTLFTLYSYFVNSNSIYIGYYYVPLVLLGSLAVSYRVDIFDKFSTPDKMLIFSILFVESVIISILNIRSSVILCIALEANMIYALYSLRKNIIAFRHECKNQC